MTVAHNRWSAQRDCFLLSAEQPAGLSFSSPWFLDIARVMGELLMPSIHMQKQNPLFEIRLNHEQLVFRKKHKIISMVCQI